MSSYLSLRHDILAAISNGHPRRQAAQQTSRGSEKGTTATHSEGPSQRQGKSQERAAISSTLGLDGKVMGVIQSWVVGRGSWVVGSREFYRYSPVADAIARHTGQVTDWETANGIETRV